MAEPPRSLTPTIEFCVLGVGAVLAGVSRLTGSDVMFVASTIICAVAGLAAVFSTALRSRSRLVHSLAAVLGFGSALFGTYWLITHSGEPEIFSPGLLSYPGAGLMLSAIIALTDSQRRNRSRRCDSPA